MQNKKQKNVFLRLINKKPFLRYIKQMNARRILSNYIIHYKYNIKKEKEVLYLG